MMKKLLLADDSITIQKVVGIILSTEEYQLEITDDGDRAFTKALEEIPDLVIADISMPGKDGFELCRSIKSEPSLSNTSVLLLPGAFDHFDEAKADEVGADGWLTKPFESQALLDKVSQLLEADPVKLAGTVVLEEKELSSDTQAEAAELDVDTAVSEEILGLDVVDALASSADKVDDDSTDDIWDTVSFAEEDLQKQVEPAGDTSTEDVSFATEVIDPSVVEEVVLDEQVSPILETEIDLSDSIDINVESDPIGEAVSEQKDIDDLQSGIIMGDDFSGAETGAPVELSEQVEASSEILLSPLDEEGEASDFSVFNEVEEELPTALPDEGDLADTSSSDKGEDLPELVDELEEVPVSVAAESDLLSIESEDEAVLELQEEEGRDGLLSAGDEINNADEVFSASGTTDDDDFVTDEIIDLTEEEIVDFESEEESVVDSVVEGVEAVVATELEPDLQDEIAEPVEEEIEPVEEEIELVEEEIELVEDSESLSPDNEDEIFYFDASATDSSEVSADMTADVVVENSAAEQVEQQLRELSEDELKDVVSKVAGPIIEKLANEMLERIAWEVVPDLAEAMISEEIRKIKEVAE